MECQSVSSGRAWELPPVILHPFSDPDGPDKLVESSRAHLMLEGLIPRGDLGQEEIERRLLDGRFCEMRMLFYVGKDLDRWLWQCAEFAERDGDLKMFCLLPDSFVPLLSERTPPLVQKKLQAWGVEDYRAIFTRALALYTLFNEPPARRDLGAHFIRYYYRYADQIFAERRRIEAASPLPEGRFDYELYASGEYARMLERKWEEI
jgi:hypothetical protein